MSLVRGRRPGRWMMCGAALALAASAHAQTVPPPSASSQPPSAPIQPPSPRPRPADEDDPEDSQHAAGTRVSGVDVVAHKTYAQQFGAVVGNIEPEIQYTPADIQTFGVSSVTQLLSELAPELRSERGRGGGSPVVLVNGRRISSINEVLNIPTEAIQRVDILPEEVALKYGYSADQKVINLVLRRRFRAVTAEASGGAATEGGQVSGGAELDDFRIRRDDRLNLDLKYAGNSWITDAARGIVQPPIGAPYDPVGDLGADKTLAPATQTLTANAVLTHPLPHGITATVNATLSANGSDALQGLQGFGLVVPPTDPFAQSAMDQTLERFGQNPLHQYVNGWTGHLGATLNKDIKSWRLSLTDAYDHTDTQTDTDAGIDPAPLQALLNANSPTFNPFAPLPGGLALRSQSVSRSISDTANIQFLANGPLLKLPAGDLYVSAKAGDTQSWQGGTSDRLGLSQSVSLSRNDGSGQLNIDVPLTSRRNHVLAFLGDFSINANGAIDQLSDYGTLKAFGYGLSWTPVQGYTLIVSHTNDQAAPTVQQLGGATVYTPGVPVFDYVTGQTVNVVQVNGGNPSLRADNRNVLKIGLTLRPIPTQDLTLSASYTRSDIDHPVLTFPAASAAIEAAFPLRFVRDANGDLVEEDIRPVNFGRSEREEIRWGFNYSRPIGKQPTRSELRAAFMAFAQTRRPGTPTPAPSADGSTPAPPPGAPAAGDSDRGRGAGGPGGPGGGGFGGPPGRFGGFPVGGRLQMAVYHTLYLTDREIVAGGPALDLLGGAPASGTGGQYRNEIEGQLGMTMAGFGGRLSLDWRQGTHVTGAPGSPTGDLAFSDLTTLNLRLFDNFTQQKAVMLRYPWLRGSRLSINITNLLDQRIRVRDALGMTPLSYQGGYLDPPGRTISISFRKLFF